MKKIPHIALVGVRTAILQLGGQQPLPEWLENTQTLKLLDKE